MKQKPGQNYTNGYFPVTGSGNPPYGNNVPGGNDPGTGRNNYTSQFTGYQKPPRKPKKNLKWLLPLIALAIALPLIVYFAGTIAEKNRIAAEEQRILREKQALVGQYSGIFADNVVIDGINISGMTVDQAVVAVSDSLMQRQNSWYLHLNYQGHTFVTLNYSVMGMEYNTDEVTAALNEAYRIGHTGDLDTDYEALTSREEESFEFHSSQSNMNTALLDTWLEQIAENIAADPVDAMLVSFSPDAEDPFEIRNEVYGRKLDTSRTKDQIIAMMMNGRSGDFELTPDPVYPAVTTADIRKSVSLLATGETPVNSASTENRTNNIRLAFSKINGMIMEPGESFSFNKVCGKRTSKNGYLDAPAYVNNEVVSEIGGGVCQASSTLYVAVRLANLNVTHREPHSMAVNYTDYGLDATVNSTGKIIDFTFVNSSGGKIYLTAHVEPTKNKKQPFRCVVSVYGPAFDPGVSYKMRTEEIELIPGDELPIIYRADDGTFNLTYTNQEKLYKAPVDGHIVAAYLQKYLNGVLVEETKVSEDYYPAQAAIWYRGTQAPPAE